MFVKFVNTNHFKNKIVRIFLKTSIIFLFAIFFANTVYAADTYVPGETITIGEFIYNDDYTPTTDNCTISVYSPAGAVLVNEVTMTAVSTGWHYYSYSTPGVEGKYPTYRLYTDNIRILCFNLDGTGCHSRLDHQPKSTLTEEGWQKVFDLQEKLKKQYPEII